MFVPAEAPSSFSMSKYCVMRTRFITSFAVWVLATALWNLAYRVAETFDDPPCR